MRDYSTVVDEAIRRGADFETDYHAQGIDLLMASLAKAHGYRKPKQANGSTGRYFFQLLQRQYDKRKGELIP